MTSIHFMRCIFMKFWAALNFYAKGSYQDCVGGNHLLGLSQSSVSRCLKEVTNLITDHLMPDVIKFPSTVLERTEVKRVYVNFLLFKFVVKEFSYEHFRFYDKFGLTSILGAIDGTHVAIVNPTEMDLQARGNLYRNRKGYHSLNVLVVRLNETSIKNFITYSNYKTVVL